MPTYGYLLPTRGIVLSSDDDATLAAKVGADVIGLAKRAEALGFGSVWVGDSVLARPRPEPLSTLAAVGAATDAVDLGTAVYLPSLRNPVHVAHLTATVDQSSGGRLALGVGVGSTQPDVEAEYDDIGVPFAERGARTNEALDVVTALWSGESVDYDGEFFDLDGASIGFGPLRKPPVYVPTGAFDPDDGFPRTIRERLVEHGDGCLPNVMSPGTYADSLDAIRGLLEGAGRNPAAFDPGFYLDAVIDEDEAAAVEEARRFYDRYYAERRTPSDGEIRARGAFGPPARVAERLDAYADAGVETMVVRFTARDQRTQLRRFADLV